MRRWWSWWVITNSSMAYTICQSLSLGLPLPSFSHVVLEEIDNHVCCWVRVKDHVKPVRRPLVPARMADLGCTCELRCIILRIPLNSNGFQLLSLLGDAFRI